MTTRKIPGVPVLLIIITVVLMSGCLSKKCDVDGDCGGDYCSENFRKAISQSCMDGRCQSTTAECADSEICVQDSRGASCYPKDPDTNKALISCSNNTINPNILTFNPTDFICRDDCPADTFCNNSCLCEEKAIIGCLNNTDNTEAAGVNVFDAAIEMCGDDCPIGTDCSNQCLCEEHDCPEPVFTDNYFDPPPIDAEFAELLKDYFENPDDFFELTEDGLITISGYRHSWGNASFLIPFPEVQLTLIPNPDNEYIPQYGAWCVNDYYEGEGALDINYDWLARPEQTCIWGGRESFEGVITVCPEILLDWFEVYTATPALIEEIMQILEGS